MAIQEISPAPPSAAQYTRPKKLNVLISDVSGSMGWAMRGLAADVKSRVRELPAGDAVLIGIFSSQGTFYWIVSRELSTDADYAHVEAVVEQRFRTIGATCFSEILADTPQAIKPFLAGFPVVTVTFMSDGCPTVWDRRGEERAIFAAAEVLKPFVTAGAVVAYGDYADRDLLGRIAKSIGLELVTAQNVTEVGEAFAKVSRGKARAKRRVKASPALILFSLDQDGTVASLTLENGEVEVADSASVYALDEILKAMPEAKDERGVTYAAALALLAENRPEEATDLLSALGDVYLVRLLDSAITNADLAKAEEWIRRAIVDENSRFIDGRQVGCRPPEDAFDVIDLLTMLQNDEEARFLPRHEAFVYKKIGRPTTPRPGFPSFKADDGVEVGINKLVGSKDKLNISTQVTIQGSVELPDEATPEGGEKLGREAVGLPKTVRTHQFRNYAVVADAMVSVTRMPCKLSRASFDKLVEVGAVEKGEYDKDRVYIVDLTAVPACNKARGKASHDWQRLAELGVESARLGAKVKVLKDRRDFLDPEREAEQSIAYTDEQNAFLKACGFDRNGAFSPPVDAEEPTDKMDIRLFEVKPKGWSSLPKVGEVLEKAKGPKPLNAPSAAMKAAHDEMERAIPKTKGAAIEWLGKEIKDVTEAKRKVDADMAARRYAAALGGWWAKDFNDDKAVFKAGDAQAPTEVTLEFRTKEVAI